MIESYFVLPILFQIFCKNETYLFEKKKANCIKSVHTYFICNINTLGCSWLYIPTSPPCHAYSIKTLIIVAIKLFIGWETRENQTYMDILPDEMTVRLVSLHLSLFLLLKIDVHVYLKNYYHEFFCLTKRIE